MGSFRKLEEYDTSKHLSISVSGKADIYIHDTLKKVHGVNIDSIFEVSDKKSFANMCQLTQIQPYLSNKWMFEIDFKKVGSLIKPNIGVFDSNSSVFSFIVKTYKEYKACKELFSDINDIYVPIIRRNDVYYLLNGYNLIPKIVDFIATSYARDPESIFTLIDFLNQGSEINSTKDIVKLIGASSGSINKFVMLLLKEKPVSAVGLKRVIKLRVQMCKDLCNAYGVSSVRNFLNSAIYSILQIKILYMNGIIYNSIINLPDAFDEVSLRKYSFYLDTIEKEIPYERILNIYNVLQKNENRVWRTEGDAISFIYGLYREVIV